MHRQSVSDKGMIVTSHDAATQAGLEILASGGNAFDAAVAAAFAIGAVEPHNTGIGGYGGFATFYHARSGEVRGVDFNTRYPVKNSQRIPTVDGASSVAIPGVVGGLSLLLDRYGTLPATQVLKSAIELTGEGFVVNETLSKALRQGYVSDEIHNLYSVNGEAPEIGQRVCNKALAQTLIRLSEEGLASFYKGDIARRIVDTLEARGGFLTDADFTMYEAVEFVPPSLPYGEYTVYAPGEHSGGDIMRAYLSLLRSETSQSLTETEELKKRLRILEQVWTKIRPFHATHPPVSVHAQHTTHLCAADGSGNLVALTLTHGPLWFGSGLLIPNMGIVMNNGLSLYSGHAGGSNSFHSGNHPYTNLCPTIVLKQDKPYLAVGTPGGTRIPSTVANFIFDVLQEGKSLAEALRSPRFHAEKTGEWWVERAWYEQVKSLEINGVNIKELVQTLFYGPLSSIQITDSGLYGITDVRYPGSARGL